MFLSPILACVVSFFFFIHMVLITCMQSIISVSYKDALMSSV